MQDILDQERLDAINIQRVPPDVPMVDVMGGDMRQVVPVHDHGFVALVDVMPRLVPEGKTADAAIVQAARVSYGAGTKKVSADRGLTRYLLRHRHTTPFEMVEFKFHCAMPLFVARQWIRHRTANVNEYSGRYSVMEDKFYRPEEVRIQSETNRQGGDALANDATAAEFLTYLEEAEENYAEYERMLDLGVSRELARVALAQTIYTQWYWKCDLHNILHFLGLRMDSHAQSEIRDYAYAMFALIQPIVPIATEAFLDYHPHMGGMSLTRHEIEALRTGQPLATQNSREQDEWAAKQQRLGITVEPTTA